MFTVFAPDAIVFSDHSNDTAISFNHCGGFSIEDAVKP